MIGSIGLIVPLMPRMFVKRSPLYELYDKIFKFIQINVKNLNVTKLEAAYYGYDIIGRRLFTLSKVHRDQN